MEYTIDPSTKKPPTASQYSGFVTTTAAAAAVQVTTLKSIPGTKIVKTMPIIYGSVVNRLFASTYDPPRLDVGHLMRQAHQELQRQAAQIPGCNAVIGVTFNVTNDSYGGHGQRWIVIVTAYGTPCTIEESTT